MRKICVIDWQSYPSLCDTLFSVYSMIRHYGFYPKRMIRHYVIHPTIYMWQFTRKSKYTVINVQFTKYFNILLFLFWYGSHVCFVPWYSQLPRSSSHWTALLSSWVSQSYNRRGYIVTSCYISQVARGGFRGGAPGVRPLYFLQR